MKYLELEDAIRDLISSQLVRTGANPQTGDDFLPATMKRHIRLSERRAYYKQIRIAPFTFLKSASLAGLGTEIIPLPDGFMSIRELRPNTTSSVRYQEVAYDELNASESYTFAFIDTSIAVKATLAVGSSLQLLYHYKYDPIDTETPSNLHDLTLDWLTYDAA